MDLEIIQMNVSSWETLVLSMLKSVLLNTTGRRLQLKKMFGRHQDNNSIVQHSADEIITAENKTIRVEYETHDNIDDEINEDNMYKLDKMSIDEK